MLGMCYFPAAADETYITLYNAEAKVTSAAYDKDKGFVTGITLGSTKVSYTAGDNADGCYDVYPEVSKQTMGFGTTPFSISVNGGDEIVPIIEYACRKGF